MNSKRGRKKNSDEASLSTIRPGQSTSTTNQPVVSYSEAAVLGTQKSNGVSRTHQNRIVRLFTRNKVPGTFSDKPFYYQPIKQKVVKTLYQGTDADVQKETICQSNPGCGSPKSMDTTLQLQNNKDNVNNCFDKKVDSKEKECRQLNIQTEDESKAHNLAAESGVTKKNENVHQNLSTEEAIQENHSFQTSVYNPQATTIRNTPSNNLTLSCAKPYCAPHSSLEVEDIFRSRVEGQSKGQGSISQHSLVQNNSYDTVSDPKNLNEFKDGRLSDHFYQSKGFSNEKNQLQAVDQVITKGKVFANYFRSFSKESLEEAEKCILGILFKIDVNMYKGKPEINPELLTFSSVVNKLQHDDPYLAKGMFVARRLGNLSKLEAEKAESSILHTLYLIETDTQGKSKVQGNIQLKNSETSDQLYNPIRQPISNWAESRETQNTAQQFHEKFSAPQTGIESEFYTFNRSSPLDDGKPADEFSKPIQFLYPTDELKANSRQLAQIEFNKNGEAHDSLSCNKEGKDLVITASQTSTTVTHRWKSSQKAENYPNSSCSTSLNMSKPFTKVTPDISKPLKKTTSAKSDSENAMLYLYLSIGFLATVVITILGLVIYHEYGLGSLLFLNLQALNFKKTSPSPPQIDIAAIMDDLKHNFNEQPSMTFKIVKSAIQTLNKINPKEPAIIGLIAEQGAEDVSSRFARQLTESVSPNNVVTISGHAFSEVDPDTAKKSIDDMLNGGLKDNILGAVFVDRLDYIPGDAALIFHTYCDHENAPFKRVAYVMTIVANQTKLKLSEPKEWDTKFQEHLYKSWSVLGIDQISALMSRLTVSVAAIVPKNED